MTYFDDLSAYTYGIHGRNDGHGALNIGWLDGRFAFAKGQTSEEFRATLGVLCSKPIGLHRGFHICDFCFPGNELRGNGQIRVQDKYGRWYAAPRMIHHYVVVHDYRPPSEFIEAVLDPIAVAICMPGQRLGIFKASTVKP